MTRALELMTRWGLTAHIAQHAAVLEQVAGPLRITSGRRSKAQNERAGGVENSFHLDGRAIDVVPASPRQRELILMTAPAQRITRGCTGPEEVLDEGDHLHLAW